MGGDQPLHQAARLDVFGSCTLARIKRAHAFHQGFFECAANRHCLTDRLHLWAETFFRAWKLLELPLGNLHNYVVNSRLEARWGLAGNVVGNFVECIPYGEPGGDLGNRKSSRLRSERRRTRDARIHLDHDHSAVRRMNSELDVRSAGLDADLANYANGRITHALIFAIREGLRRSNSNGVSGVHTHRIEVLD